MTRKNKVHPTSLVSKMGIYERYVKPNIVIFGLVVGASYFGTVPASLALVRVSRGMLSDRMAASLVQGSFAVGGLILADQIRLF
jgi:hypothetical protein